MELHRVENFFDEIELVGNSNGFELKAKDIEWWSKEDADEDEGIIIMRDLEDETFEEVLSRDSDSIHVNCSVSSMWGGNVSEEIAEFKDDIATASIDSDDLFESYVTDEEYFKFHFISNEIQEIANERKVDSDKENKVVNNGGRVWGLKLFEEFEQNYLRNGAASICKDVNSNFNSEDRDSNFSKNILKPLQAENGKNKKKVATNKRTRLTENNSDAKVDAKRVRQSERINTRKVAEKKRPLMEISNTFENSQMVTSSKKAKLENSRTVQIIGLHPEETESTIFERYKEFGKILKTKLSIANHGKTVGFVTFSSAKSATKCLKNGNYNTNLLYYDMQIIK